MAYKEAAKKARGAAVEIRGEAMRSIAKILTKRQRENYQKMIGEPFDFTKSWAPRKTDEADSQPSKASPSSKALTKPLLGTEPVARSGVTTFREVPRHCLVAHAGRLLRTRLPPPAARSGHRPTGRATAGGPPHRPEGHLVRPRHRLPLGGRAAGAGLLGPHGAATAAGLGVAMHLGPPPPAPAGGPQAPGGARARDGSRRLRHRASLRRRRGDRAEPRGPQEEGRHWLNPGPNAPPWCSPSPEDRGRPSKEPYIATLRDRHGRQDHPVEPLPPQVRPMLPGNWANLDPEENQRIEHGPGWIVQPRLDGVRALLHIESNRARDTSRCIREVTYCLGHRNRVRRRTADNNAS